MNGVNVDLKTLIRLANSKLDLKLNTIAKSNRHGAHHSLIRGRGMDFSEVRRYQAGDDIRHMQWKVTAKTGKPHIKLYQEEKERPVLLVCSFNPSMYFASKNAFKSVQAAKVAAILAWHFSKAGDRVGGIFYRGEHLFEQPPKARKQGVLPLLNQLAKETKHESQIEIPLSHALTPLRKVAKPGSLIIIISDFLDIDDKTKTHIQRLRNHCDLVAIRISDPLEHHAPKANCYPIANLKGESALLDTSQKNTIKAYQSFCHNIEKNISNVFYANECIEISTSDNQSDIVKNLSRLAPKNRGR